MTQTQRDIKKSYEFSIMPTRRETLPKLTTIIAFTTYQGTDQEEFYQLLTYKNDMN